MHDEVVTRLYRCLVEELGRRDHDPEQPVKVSELYQHLVPYQAVRSTLGVDLNADYEHALLRLLAGERGLLRLEPAEAREELRREVDAPYPFVGLFRKFSASDVWVAMDKLAARPAGAANDPAAATVVQPELALDRAEPPAPRAGAMDLREPSFPPAPRSASVHPHPAGAPRIAASAEEAAPVGRGGGPVPARVPAPVKLHREGAPTDPTDRMTRADADCVFCEEALPAGRRVRFCPRCGGDQRLRPCPRCDAVLELEWRYCISCGHEVGNR